MFNKKNVSIPDDAILDECQNYMKKLSRKLPGPVWTKIIALIAQAKNKGSWIVVTKTNKKGNKYVVYRCNNCRSEFAVKKPYCADCGSCKMDDHGKMVIEDNR